MTKIAFACLIGLAVCIGALTAATAQTCTSSTFIGTTTTKCSDGTTGTSSDFMGTTTTRIQPPPVHNANPFATPPHTGATTCTSSTFMGSTTMNCRSGDTDDLRPERPPHRRAHGRPGGVKPPLRDRRLGIVAGADACRK